MKMLNGFSILSVAVFIALLLVNPNGAVAESLGAYSSGIDKAGAAAQGSATVGAVGAQSSDEARAMFLIKQLAAAKKISETEQNALTWLVVNKNADKAIA